jgi:hypothetical protein
MVMQNEELMKEIDQLSIEQKQALLDDLVDSVLRNMEHHLIKETIELELGELSPLNHRILLLWMNGLNVKGIADTVGVDVRAASRLLRVLQSQVLYRLPLDSSPSMNKSEKGFDSEISQTGQRHSDQGNQSVDRDKSTLSQRLFGILEFDGGPPDDEATKDGISDYLIGKYS